MSQGSVLSKAKSLCEFFCQREASPNCGQRALGDRDNLINGSGLLEQCLAQANGEDLGGMKATAIFCESDQLPGCFRIVPEAPDVIDRRESNSRTPETIWEIGFASLTQLLMGCGGIASHAASWTDELKQRIQRISRRWMNLEN